MTCRVGGLEGAGHDLERLADPWAAPLTVNGAVSCTSPPSTDSVGAEVTVVGS